MEIGPALRAMRRSRAVSLGEIARKTGLSKSFISEVESGAANPSIASLARITSALNLPLGALFVSPGDAPEAECTSTDAVVIRRESRRMLIAPRGDGTLFQLAPHDCRRLEMNQNEYQPGYDTGEEMLAHMGEECGLVLSGVLELTVNGVVYVLAAGDSIYFPSHLPHRFRNRGTEVVQALWVNTPRSDRPVNSVRRGMKHAVSH